MSTQIVVDEITAELHADVIEVVELGVQGLPGTGGGNAVYVHHQTTPTTQWIINHNLGYYPHVSVLSVGLVEITADVQHVSVNQTQIQFSIPTAGLARCS